MKGFRNFNSDDKIAKRLFSTHGIAIKNIDGKKIIFDNAKLKRKELTNIDCFIDSLSSFFEVHTFFLN